MSPLCDALLIFFLRAYKILNPQIYPQINNNPQTCCQSVSAPVDVKVRAEIII